MIGSTEICVMDAVGMEAIEKFQAEILAGIAMVIMIVGIVMEEMYKEVGIEIIRIDTEIGSDGIEIGADLEIETEIGLVIGIDRGTVKIETIFVIATIPDTVTTFLGSMMHAKIPLAR